MISDFNFVLKKEYNAIINKLPNVCNYVECPRYFIVIPIKFEDGQKPFNLSEVIEDKELLLAKAYNIPIIKTLYSCGLLRQPNFVLTKMPAIKNKDFLMVERGLLLTYYVNEKCSAIEFTDNKYIKLTFFNLTHTPDTSIASMIKCEDYVLVYDLPIDNNPLASVTASLDLLHIVIPDLVNHQQTSLF